MNLYMKTNVQYQQETGDLAIMTVYSRNWKEIPALQQMVGRYHDSKACEVLEAYLEDGYSYLGCNTPHKQYQNATLAARNQVMVFTVFKVKKEL